LKPNIDEPVVESIDFFKDFTTDKKFSPQDGMLTWIWGEAVKLGFVIVITRLDYESNRRKRTLVFECERCGVCKNYKKQLKRQDTYPKIVSVDYFVCVFVMVSTKWSVSCSKRGVSVLLHNQTLNLPLPAISTGSVNQFHIHDWLKFEIGLNFS